MAEGRIYTYLTAMPGATHGILHYTYRCLPAYLALLVTTPYYRCCPDHPPAYRDGDDEHHTCLAT